MLPWSAWPCANSIIPFIPSLQSPGRAWGVEAQTRNSHYVLASATPSSVLRQLCVKVTQTAYCATLSFSFLAEKNIVSPLMITGPRWEPWYQPFPSPIVCDYSLQAQETRDMPISLSLWLQSSRVGKWLQGRENWDRFKFETSDIFTCLGRIGTLNCLSISFSSIKWEERQISLMDGFRWVSVNVLEHAWVYHSFYKWDSLLPQFIALTLPARWPQYHQPHHLL